MAEEKKPQSIRGGSASQSRFVEPTPEELRESATLAEVLGALERGRAGIDEIPNVHDDELEAQIAMAHLLRAQRPSAQWDAHRSERVWERIRVAPSQVFSRVREARPPRWMTALGWGVAAAFAMLLVLRGGAPVGEQPSTLLRTSPSAVSAVNDAIPSYAADLMAPGQPPRGDTRLRELRSARFEAFRTDASRRHRYGGGW